jgi:hypothetical protein
MNQTTTTFQQRPSYCRQLTILLFHFIHHCKESYFAWCRKWFSMLESTIERNPILIAC